MLLLEAAYYESWTALFPETVKVPLSQYGTHFMWPFVPGETSCDTYQN